MHIVYAYVCMGGMLGILLQKRTLCSHTHHWALNILHAKRVSQECVMTHAMKGPQSFFNGIFLGTSLQIINYLTEGECELICVSVHWPLNDSHYINKTDQKLRRYVSDTANSHLVC